MLHKIGNEGFMAEKQTDIKTKYEYLIAGILVLVLSICAFAFYRVTKYTRSDNQAEPVIATSNSDGTVLIEVEISQETISPEESELLAEAEAVAAEKAALEAINVHDHITIFTTTVTGANYYVSKDGRLTLYSEPDDSNTDEPRPALQENRAFEVIGFSRDGWAAIELGGIIYYVKSAEITGTEAPEDAAEKHTEPKNTQNIRFFTPTDSSSFEYVVTMNTVGYSLPDVESTGNRIDLKAGERVIVSATCGDWYKILYMNAEYYVLSYLEPRDVWIEENPGEEVKDNTGYAEPGSPEAASSAAAGNGGASGTPSDNQAATDSGSSDAGDSGSSDSGSSYSGDSVFVRELLDLTNELRAEAGLAPLSWSDTLAECAAARAEELPQVSNEQNAAHQRPNGQPWYTVNGYNENNSPLYAENIAYGQLSAQEVFEAWKNSTGHYNNMMNPDYRTFGAALYYTDSGYEYYWIEEFGY